MWPNCMKLVCRFSPEPPDSRRLPLVSVQLSVQKALGPSRAQVWLTHMVYLTNENYSDTSQCSQSERANTHHSGNTFLCIFCHFIIFLMTERRKWKIYNKCISYDFCFRSQLSCQLFEVPLFSIVGLWENAFVCCSTSSGHCAPQKVVFPPKNGRSLKGGTFWKHQFVHTMIMFVSYKST